MGEQRQERIEAVEQELVGFKVELSVCQTSKGPEKTSLTNFGVGWNDDIYIFDFEQRIIRAGWIRTQTSGTKSTLTNHENSSLATFLFYNG